MSAHTPGPWFVPHFARMPDGCKCGFVFSEYQQGMGAICEVTYDGEDEPRETAAANARLIAAAPELLEALDKCLRRAIPHSDDTDADRVRNLYHIEATARAAIRKATGETK